MKSSTKDIREFIKSGKEKPMIYRDGKMIIPTSRGNIVEKLKNKKG